MEVWQEIAKNAECGLDLTRIARGAEICDNIRQ
jgi:hypothetical protein